MNGSYNGAVKGYVTSATYAPHGEPWTVSLGNNLVQRTSYNSRLQIATWRAAYQDQDSDQYLGNVLNYGTANNGNVRSITEYNGGPGYPAWLQFTQTYAYDGVNRLQSVVETTPAGATSLSRSFAYDPYGNGWVTGGTGTVPNALTITSNVYNPATNRVNGSSYDPAGNLLSLGLTSLSYDAEDRQKQASQPGYPVSTYSYDAEGRRVKKVTASGTEIFVYDVRGLLVAQYKTGSEAPASCRTCYLTWDHLGSTRMVTDENANLVTRHDYLPFGEEITSGIAGRDSSFGRGDFVNQKFTGKERDSESGLDYFGARYYGSALGRFTSPDPLPGWAKDPQSWNMYAYGRNNPLKYVDPDGETYRVCDSSGRNCNNLSDSDFESEQKTSQGNGEHFNNGSLYHYDANGSRVNDGTYNQTDVDINPGVASALHTAGVQSSAQLNAFMRDAAMTAAGGLVFSGAAAAVAELAPAAEGLPLLRQVSNVLSNNSLKHIAKHLDQFQKLDPSLTMNKIVDIGTDVARTGSQVAGNAFTKTVQIGGQEVTVRAVLNSNNALRSVHILQ